MSSAFMAQGSALGMDQGIYVFHVRKPYELLGISHSSGYILLDFSSKVSNTYIHTYTHARKRVAQALSAALLWNFEAKWR